MPDVTVVDRLKVEYMQVSVLLVWPCRIQGKMNDGTRLCLSINLSSGVIYHVIDLSSKASTAPIVAAHAVRIHNRPTLTREVLD